MIEDNLHMIVVDEQIAKKRGFLRALPLITALKGPYYSYHAKLWYVPYVKEGTLFTHTWIYEDSIPVLESENLCLYIKRAAIEVGARLLTNIYRFSLSHGALLILAMDDAEDFKISRQSVRYVTDLIKPHKYLQLYASWLEDFYHNTGLPPLRARSKTILLPIFQLIEHIFGRTILSIEDMMGLKSPFLCKLIIEKISRIRGLSDFTDIRHKDIIYFLLPWLDNTEELRLVTRKTEDLIKDAIEGIEIGNLGQASQVLENLEVLKLPESLYKQIERVVLGCVV